MQTYYFTGEFGIFNIFVLPELEKYDGPKICIRTYPDYCHIIQNLFTDKYKLEEIPLFDLRCGHLSFDDKLNKENTIEKYKNDAKNLSVLFPYIGEHPNCNLITQYDYISKQITTDYKDDSKNFICYFPRFRNPNYNNEFNRHWNYRNSNQKEFDTIVNSFGKNHKIFVLGKETINLDSLPPNVEKVEDINKMIFYLKNCEFLISNDSGFVDFAKNCGCKKMLVIRPIEKYHFIFNPFGSQVNALSDQELHKLYFLNQKIKNKELVKIITN